jgi:hypothetical protein
MIATFKRTALSDAYTEGWLVFDQLGGVGECDKRLKEIMGQWYGPPRIFVLADSDQAYPGHVTQSIEKVQNSCRPLRIPYVILRKRKIENYLPLHILQQVNRDRYKAYLHLQPLQKDHYEMKKGFKEADNGNAIVPPEQVALYLHVPPHILRGLCGGFGKHVAAQFEAHKGKVQEHEVRIICTTDPGEIDRILDEIEAII